MTEQANDVLLESLRKKIRYELNETSDTMTGGGCKNFPEYTHYTGIIKGLAWAESMLLELDEKITAE